MQITIPGGKQFRVPWGFIAGFGAAAVVGLIAALLMTLVFGGSSAGSAIGASEAGNSAPASASATLNSQQGDIGATEKVAKDPAQATNQKAPATAREVTSGKYKLSQITSSSPNMLVALFGAVREGIPGVAREYIERETLVKKASFYSDSNLYRLRDIAQDPDEGDWLLIGNLRLHPSRDTSINPKEAVPNNHYSVSTLYASPCLGGAGDCVAVSRVEFEVYKTPSGEWRIADILILQDYNLWAKRAFEYQLKKANNEPFNIYR